VWIDEYSTWVCSIKSSITDCIFQYTGVEMMLVSILLSSKYIYPPLSCLPPISQYLSRSTAPPPANVNSGVEIRISPTKWCVLYVMLVLVSIWQLQSLSLLVWVFVSVFTTESVYKSVLNPLFEEYISNSKLFFTITLPSQFAPLNSFLLTVHSDQYSFTWTNRIVINKDLCSQIHSTSANNH